jgi:hypothetical protein
MCRTKMQVKLVGENGTEPSNGRQPTDEIFFQKIR